MQVTAPSSISASLSVCHTLPVPCSRLPRNARCNTESNSCSGGKDLTARSNRPCILKFFSAANIPVRAGTGICSDMAQHESTSRLAQRRSCSRRTRAPQMPKWTIKDSRLLATWIHAACLFCTAASRSLNCTEPWAPPRATSSRCRRSKSHKFKKAEAEA